MTKENLVPLTELAIHYNIEHSFFVSLDEWGLVEIITVEEAPFIEREHLEEVERMIRLHSDLGINIEGIEAISHLLRKVEELQREVLYLRNHFPREQA